MANLDVNEVLKKDMTAGEAARAEFIAGYTNLLMRDVVSLQDASMSKYQDIASIAEASVDQLIHTVTKDLEAKIYAQATTLISYADDLARERDKIHELKELLSFTGSRLIHEARDTFEADYNIAYDEPLKNIVDPYDREPRLQLEGYTEGVMDAIKAVRSILN